LFTHIRLGLPSGLFPSGFPTNILYSFLVSPIRAICPTHLILLDPIILIMNFRYTSYITNYLLFLQITYHGYGNSTGDATMNHACFSDKAREIRVVIQFCWRTFWQPQ
jgi:hypothetical protein